MAKNNKKLYLSALTPCCVDYYPQSGKFYAGGNSLNVAAVWNGLEPQSHVSVITCLGNDEYGKIILDFLEKTTIDCSRVYVKEGITANNQLRVDEKGERFGVEGAWQGGVYETFLLSEKDWEWINQQDIVAMPANNPNFPHMLRRKHKDQLLSVDYLDAENNIPMQETVALTDIAFISAHPDLLPFYRKLADKTKKLIVVTLGAEGSYAFYNGLSHYQPALPAPKVTDTTGCGDAYQAAFALNYYRTRDIQRSMLSGAGAALRVLQHWGGAGI